MAKVTIEMVDDEDGMVFAMSGDPIPTDGTQSLAQTIGLMVGSMVTAQIYDEVLEFIAKKLPRR